MAEHGRVLEIPQQSDFYNEYIRPADSRVFVLISEQYPTKVRGLAMSIAGFALWIGTYLIGQLTPWMLQNLTPAGTLFDVYLCGSYPGAGWVDDTFYTRPFYADGNAPYYLVEGAWTPENRNAKYPRLSTDARLNGGKYSDWWVKNGTYIRLKNAQIGYTLPTELTRKVGIEKVRAYVSGSNLFTLTGVKYFDPEMPNVNQGYYPQQRVYEFGLNITF